MPEDPTYHEAVDYDVREHGRRWAVCNACGAQWAITETSLGDGFELVTEGDESCLARAAEGSK